MALDVRDADAGAVLRVRVKPRGSRDRLEGEWQGALVARVTAAPVAGDANDALIRLLAQALGLPRSSVKILRGAGTRDKLVLFQGVAAVDVRARLAMGRSS